MISAPAPQFEENSSCSAGLPDGWMSALDMINFGLSSVFAVLQVVRQHLDHAAIAMSQGNGTQPINPDYKKVVEGNLKFAHQTIANLLLQSAEDRIILFWQNFGSDKYNYVNMAMDLKPLLEQLEADLRREHFYHYPRRKTFPLITFRGEWAATLKAFPSVENEIEEGVDCYAIGHNTAAVFHMMRVAEIGLRVLARERGVSFPKTGKPLEWAEWQTLIENIAASGRDAAAKLPVGPQRDAARDFYSGAVHHFEGLKDKYRNMVMHMRRSYDEHDALQAINQVRDFMNGLSAKIGEKTKKPIRKWP